MPIQISIHAPAAPDALAVVDAGLEQFNCESARLNDVQPLHVIVTGADGKTCGGAVGRTWGRCCELQQLWVAPECRGQKQGTWLMDAFEREAALRGCSLVYLESFSFQAPAFYAMRGYEEVLRIAGFTGGVVKITLQKRLFVDS